MDASLKLLKKKIDKNVTSVHSRDLPLDSTQNGGYDEIVPQDYRFGKSRDPGAGTIYPGLASALESNDDSWDLIRGESLAAWTEFHYIITTGSGWNGPFSSADAIFQFPYNGTAERLFGETQDALAGDNMAMSGKNAIWYRENFKPDRNISIKLINPTVWISILEAKKAIATNPNDSEAWGHLG